MGVSVWENHEDLELVGRAACQIPQTFLEKTNHFVDRISGFPQLVPWAQSRWKPR